MILAEELEADLKQITIEQAGASTLFGDQSTGGSASVRTTWDPMRKAGRASSRDVDFSAAAAAWGVPRESCKAESASVIHSASGRKLSYGSLATKASTLPVPDNPPLKSGGYKLVGKSTPAPGYAFQGQRLCGLRNRFSHSGDEVCVTGALRNGRRQGWSSFDDARPSNCRA